MLNKDDYHLYRNILLTLAYTDQFCYPQTEFQVWLRLLGRKTFSIQEVKSGLAWLQKTKLVESSHNFCYLKGRSSLVEVRKTRNRIAQKKWIQTHLLVLFLKQIPWIKAIFVTGALAVKNTPKDDDIDIMIITAKNRMWLTRVVVVVFSIIVGKRRSWKHEEPNSWCFNVWLDEGSLEVPKNSQSVYTAYEVLQAEPIYVVGDIYFKWLQANNWVSKYLPNFFTIRLGSSLMTENAKSRFNLNFVWDRLNNWLKAWQWWYMQTKKTREIVGNRMAYFHPRDTHTFVMKNWFNSLARLKDHN